MRTAADEVVEDTTPPYRDHLPLAHLNTNNPASFATLLQDMGPQIGSGGVSETYVAHVSYSR